MKKTTTVLFRDGKRSSATFEIPAICPHCGLNMTPDILNAQSVDNVDDHYFVVGLFLRCTNTDCLQYYALAFNGSHPNTYIRQAYDLIKYSYTPPINDGFPDEIEKLSPTFKHVYDQSLKSEQLKLNQLSGIGYRKSVEFLIKDYLINLKGKDEEKVKKQFLGAAIKSIEYSPLTSLATAATWIGNDETHYVKKWVDKDIQDMKAFIRSAVFFISAEYQASEAQSMIEQNN